MFRKLVPLAAAALMTTFALTSSAAGAAAPAPKPTPSPTARAATPAAASVKSESAVGSITSLDANTNTLVLKEKSKSETFSVPATANITSHGKEIKLGDLKVGEKLEVAFTLQGNVKTATHITLLGHA